MWSNLGEIVLKFKFHKIQLSHFRVVGVEIRLFPLLWLIQQLALYYHTSRYIVRALVLHTDLVGVRRDLL